MILIGEFVEENGIYEFVASHTEYDESPMTIIRAEHMAGINKKNVTKLSASNVDFFGTFPGNLSYSFPNLKEITMTSCGIKQITRKSLAGIQNLMELRLVGNELSYLPNDVFDSSPRLKFISLYANKLQLVGGDIFDALDDLQYVNFQLNPQFDICYRKHGKGVSLNELKMLMKAKWEQNISNNLHDSAIIHSIKARSVGVHLNFGPGTQHSILQMIIDESRRNGVKSSK